VTIEFAFGVNPNRDNALANASLALLLKASKPKLIRAATQLPVLYFEYRRSAFSAKRFRFH